MRLRYLAPVALLLLTTPLGPMSTASPRVDVRLVTDEADAVLAILAARGRGEAIGQPAWTRLYGSEGYRRLARREAAMKRPFTDEDFREFVLTGELLERAPDLARTLENWRRVDVSSAARRAQAYLSDRAVIRATIYPVIKPRENSFVFELKTDPAIFLYLDPSISAAQFENTLAHELHHVGFASVERPAGEALPEGARLVVKWAGAFGEGLAMLAAAGGPDVHPHLTSASDDRARWNRDVARFDEHLREVESFFLAVLDGRLSEEETNARALAFFGEQGPWYTVGWKMAVTIERAYGRAAVVEAFADGGRLLATYNRAAAEHNRRTGAKLALWAPELVTRVAP